MLMPWNTKPHACVQAASVCACSVHLRVNSIATAYWHVTLRSLTCSASTAHNRTVSLSPQAFCRKSVDTDDRSSIDASLISSNST